MTRAMGCLEYRNNRHAINDLAGLNHTQHFGKREGTHLDEFCLIRGECLWDQIGAQKEMGCLIHNALAGVIRTDMGKMAGSVAGFLGEFALHGCLERFASVHSTGGHFPGGSTGHIARSEEHTSELQSQSNLVCRLLLEK